MDWTGLRKIQPRIKNDSRPLISSEKKGLKVCYSAFFNYWKYWVSVFLGKYFVGYLGYRLTKITLHTERSKHWLAEGSRGFVHQKSKDSEYYCILPSFRATTVSMSMSLSMPCSRFGYRIVCRCFGRLYLRVATLVRQFSPKLARQARWRPCMSQSGILCCTK